jgi:Domain of unknown function (DUF397)
VSDAEHTGLPWRKSSASAGGGNCVEVAMGLRAVYVRHSANIGGPVLAFLHSEWEAFLDGVRNCEFDPPTSSATAAEGD